MPDHETDDESALRLLASGYFHQDYKLFASDQDDAVRRFIDGEGQESVEQLIVEIRALLAGSATEQELDHVWTKRYFANFTPSRIGLTYRAWFERVLEILRSDGAAAPG